MYRFCASPTTLTDALKLKAEHGAAARFIAGGTDLLIELTRDSAPDSDQVGLIDLTRIRAWLTSGKRMARSIWVLWLRITSA